MVKNTQEFSIAESTLDFTLYSRSHHLGWLVKGMICSIMTTPDIRFRYLFSLNPFSNFSRLLVSLTFARLCFFVLHIAAYSAFLNLLSDCFPLVWMVFVSRSTELNTACLLVISGIKSTVTVYLTSTVKEAVSRRRLRPSPADTTFIRKILLGLILKKAAIFLARLGPKNSSSSRALEDDKPIRS